MALNLFDVSKHRNVELTVLEVNPMGLSTEERQIIEHLSTVLEIERNSVNGIGIIAEQNVEGDLVVSRSGQNIHISYPSKVGFARALSHVREVWLSGKTVREHLQVEDSGLMLDCSRNAVLTVSSVQHMLNYMAAMGLNVLMLYTEDTYELPKYPYFGYQRGAYSAEEMRAIDDYAWSLGIEVIPCIQTLAHLRTTLRWPYANVFKDTEDVLMVDNEETYKFIDEMFSVMHSAFRSRRIHIGMDEAWGLGRGKYMDKYGYEEPYAIMHKHLDKIVDLAKKYDYTPLMWSDMYFRFSSPNHQYYEPDNELTAEVQASISDQVGLVYWDYYHYEQEVYDIMFKRHMETKASEVWFAGGIQTWNGIKSSAGKAFGTSEPALISVRHMGIQHMITTAWGDNGSEVSVFEALLPLQQFGEATWKEAVPGREEVIERFTKTFGIDGEAFYTMRLFDEVPGVAKDNPKTLNPSKYILFSDVLMGNYDAHITPMGDALVEHYTELADYFDYCTNVTEGKAKLFYLQSAQLADVLARKIRLILDLRPAYLGNNQVTLRNIIKKDLPELIVALKDLQAFTLSIWYLYNKPEGSEVIDIRYGGQLARLKTCLDRVEGYLNGVYDSIPELEIERLPVDGKSLSETMLNPHTHANIYTNIATMNPL